MLLTSTAYAQDLGAAPTEATPLSGLLPVIIMIVLFYFLLIRPQQKKIKDHKKMVEALRRGDKIITAGGIFGSIARVDDDALLVEIADDTKIKIDKGSVSTVLTRSEPADTAEKPKKEKKTDKTAAKKPKAAND